MMDIIFVHGLTVECVIGVWEWERRIKQKIELDLDIAVDIRNAAASDHLDDTVNYKAIAKRVIAHTEQSRYKLVETLAASIASILVEEFLVPWCRVRINKGRAVHGARSVGVVIERGKRTDRDE